MGHKNIAISTIKRTIIGFSQLLSVVYQFIKTNKAQVILGISICIRSTPARI